MKIGISFNLFNFHTSTMCFRSCIVMAAPNYGLSSLSFLGLFFSSEANDSVLILFFDSLSFCLDEDFLVAVRVVEEFCVC